jgi:hypothetical protein
MSQTVYVLTTLMGENPKLPKEWRPVGVVTSLDIAEQWVAHGGNNDWIPFEIDDTSLTGLSDNPSVFKPAPPTPNEEKLEKANQQLQGVIQTLQKRLEKKKPKASLLNKKRR